MNDTALELEGRLADAEHTLGSLLRRVISIKKVIADIEHVCGITDDDDYIDIRALPGQTKSAMRHAKIATWPQLAKYTEREVGWWQYCGKKCIEVYRAELAKRGLTFRKEKDEG